MKQKVRRRKGTLKRWKGRRGSKLREAIKARDQIVEKEEREPKVGRKEQEAMEEMQTANELCQFSYRLPSDRFKG